MKKYKHTNGTIGEVREDGRLYCTVTSSPVSYEESIYPLFYVNSNDWQEVVEKNYKIMSFVNNGFENGAKGFVVPLNNGIYSAKGYEPLPKEKCTLEACLKHKYLDIHSIKRLSDGVIFTVGDTIISKDCSGPGCEINSMIIKNEKLVINASYAKKILFTTEDGIELFDSNDRVFGVLPKAQWQTNYYMGEGIDICKLLDSHTGKLKSTAWKWFSTEEKAEEYRSLNKLCFSWNDIETILPMKSYSYISTLEIANRFKAFLRNK